MTVGSHPFSFRRIARVSPAIPAPEMSIFLLATVVATPDVASSGNELLSPCTVVAIVRASRRLSGKPENRYYGESSRQSRSIIKASLFRQPLGDPSCARFLHSHC